MFTRITIIVSCLVVAGCGSSTPKGAKPKHLTTLDSIRQALNQPSVALPEAARKMYDTMGVKIDEIAFALVHRSPNSISYGISIEDPGSSLSFLSHADDLVLPFNKVTLAIDYPLAKPVYVEITTREKGFTRKMLIQEISNVYHKIYKEEEASAKIKTMPVEKRLDSIGLLNRNQTNGKYGIWGHDLADLYLAAIDVYRNSKGEVFLDLDINS